MKKQKYLGGIKLIILLPLILIALFAGLVLADDQQDAKELVTKARLTFENLIADQNLDAIRPLIKQAKGVFLAPQLLKGGFVLGGSGGSGVPVVQDEKTGEWNGPAFYTMGGISWGLQIGGEASEVILLLLTQRGVTSFLTTNFKLGADVGVAIGPMGVGASAATANLSADILSFSRSKGLYGGFSLSGVVVATREDLNNAYYGKKVTTINILINRQVTNPGADELIKEISKAAAPAK